MLVGKAISLKECNFSNWEVLSLKEKLALVILELQPSVGNQCESIFIITASEVNVGENEA